MLVAVQASSNARADEARGEPHGGTPRPTLAVPVDPGLAECTLFAMSACRRSLIIEAGGGPGAAHFGEDPARLPAGSRFVGQYFVAAGFVAQTSPQSNTHWGPVIEWAVGLSEVRTDWTLSPSVRLRWFPFAGRTGRAFVLEPALGAQLEHFWYLAPLRELGSGTRLGGMGELGLGWRGIIGPWTQLSLLADPFDGHGKEVWFFGGIRFNLGAVVLTGASYDVVPPPRPYIGDQIRSWLTTRRSSADLTAS
ncbi:MAG: hypothetical protein HYZ29_15945 [Myxococcales bacterium]|nr:hypothetical protein [Myxococcales bacterium]